MNNEGKYDFGFFWPPKPPKPPLNMCGAWRPLHAPRSRYNCIIAESKKLSRKKKLAEKKIVRKKIGKCTQRAARGIF